MFKKSTTLNIVEWQTRTAPSVDSLKCCWEYLSESSSLTHASLWHTGPRRSFLFFKLQTPRLRSARSLISDIATSVKGLVSLVGIRIQGQGRILPDSYIFSAWSLNKWPNGKGKVNVETEEVKVIMVVVEVEDGLEVEVEVEAYQFLGLFLWMKHSMLTFRCMPTVRSAQHSFFFSLLS